jgi:uncharacterized membrane protein YkoI
MSLLKKPNVHTRWKKSLLIAVSLLLLVPCAAAAAFAMRFDVAQDPAAQEPERKDREKLEMKRRMPSDPALVQEMERRRELEIEMKEVAEAAMVKLARITMEQAIQIATTQQPGKVLMSSLGAKGWEEPGKLGKDGVVFYHVIIADEVNPGSTHVWVNAIDGTIIKSEKELLRKKREQ